MKKFITIIFVSFTYGIIITLLKSIGITLGGIPTILLFLVINAVPMLISKGVKESKKLDEEFAQKNNNKNNVHSNSNDENSEIYTNNKSLEKIPNNNKINFEQQDTKITESETQDSSKKLNNNKNNVPLFISLITVSIIAIICIIFLCVVTTKSTNNNLTTTTTETTVTSSTTNNNSSRITLSDEERSKNHEEAKIIDLKNSVQKKYDELMDRDELLNKNYDKTKTTNDSIKMAIGMQKDLYQTFINDKESLVSIFGEKKYNEMLKNIKSIANRNYYKDNDYLDWDYIDAVAKEKDNKAWEKEKNGSKPN